MMNKTIHKTGWVSLGIAAALAAALPLGGCESQTSPRMLASQDAYKAGDYATAYREARAVADAPNQSRANRDSAAYMAGMSAFRNRDSMAAQLYLEQASTSPDPALAADAKASLGLVFADRGLYGLSALSLLDAAALMNGQDRANALFYAGVSQQKDGRWPQARTTLSLAISNSRDGAFRRRVSEQLRITGYTLQTAQYDVESQAQDAAMLLAHRAAERKMSPPRVVPTYDPASKRQRYLVWVGQFSSWPTAVSARESLGITSAAVTPLTEPIK